jgi:glycolate oxidase FAD binding subunit
MATANHDDSQTLRELVREAAATRTPVRIRGGNSKAFYGRESLGKPLLTTAHRGILSYEPTELVITARAGTPLQEVEAVLADARQMLGFEPPYFATGATLGGTIACGLSGPRRPYAGSVRDFVLGVRMLNGTGEILQFGGQVMKNVAGYDLSRLQAGALGTLGVILEVSLKVLPRPAVECTLIQQCSPAAALEALKRWARKPYPLSAVAYVDDTLYLRLSGAASAVAAASHQLGGDPLAEGTAFWHTVREHTHSFFQGDTPLWRLSVPPVTPLLQLPGSWFLDWGGAQRWLRGDAPATTMQQVAATAGGHATGFRGGDRQGPIFQPLEPVMQRLHRQLKHSFDPYGIFNPGRLYADF